MTFSGTESCSVPRSLTCGEISQSSHTARDKPGSEQKEPQKLDCFSSTAVPALLFFAASVFPAKERQPCGSACREMPRPSRCGAAEQSGSGAGRCPVGPGEPGITPAPGNEPLTGTWRSFEGKKIYTQARGCRFSIMRENEATWLTSKIKASYTRWHCSLSRAASFTLLLYKEKHVQPEPSGQTGIPQTED